MKKLKYGRTVNLYLRLGFIVLAVLAIFIGIGFYVFNVKLSSENSFINWSSWPAYYTSNFDKEISLQNGNVQLTESAVNDLKKYKLTLQVINENGDVIFEYNEYQDSIKHYSPMEMVQLYKTGGAKKDCTKFVGSISDNGEEYAYIIGFPAKISKITLYFNHDNYLNVKFIILGLFIMVLLSIIAYGTWINHILSKIIDIIRRIASNAGEMNFDEYKRDCQENTDSIENFKEKRVQSIFKLLKENGIYNDVFSSLYFLDNKIKACEEERKRTEKLREEWIANISHDLKTPLSPIRGYAEILTDAHYRVGSDEVNKYGRIILRNAENVEEIVENLNFTYQLKNGMMSMKCVKGNIVRLLKEVVINILNHPQYEERTINFNACEDRIDFNFDKTLLMRAFTNLLYNSVIHNCDQTIINVSIKKEDKLYIKIEDNGKGMTKEETERLFERYYRGTNSSENVKGSGLGMAISKQIIEAHEGRIKVMSTLNVGTSIEIEFDLKQ